VQIEVFLFHETEHLVVAEADLLELVVGEVVGLVLALGVPVEAIEAGLDKLLAFAQHPILHGPVEIGVALDAARRRPSALLLFLAALHHAPDTIWPHNRGFRGFAKVSLAILGVAASHPIGGAGHPVLPKGGVKNKKLNFSFFKF
jgi:hypothetical protein